MPLSTRTSRLEPPSFLPMETTHVTATLAASVGELTDIMPARAKWARRSLALNKHRARCRVLKNQMKTMKKKSLTRMTTNQTKTMKMTVLGTGKLKLMMKLPWLDQERVPARDNIWGELEGPQTKKIHSGYAATLTEK